MTVPPSAAWLRPFDKLRVTSKLQKLTKRSSTVFAPIRRESEHFCDLDSNWPEKPKLTIVKFLLKQKKIENFPTISIATPVKICYYNFVKHIILFYYTSS